MAGVRHQIQVLVSGDEWRSLTGGDNSTLLQRLGLPEEKVKDIKVLNSIFNWEMDAVILTLEHPKYAPVAELVELPRYRLNDKKVLPDGK
jgi:hypothetical protein